MSNIKGKQQDWGVLSHPKASQQKNQKNPKASQEKKFQKHPKPKIPKASQEKKSQSIPGKKKIPKHPRKNPTASQEKFPSVPGEKFP